MINTISDFTLSLWKNGRKTKNAPTGWISGNAPCCIHNGETADTRGRGGLIVASNGEVSWHCFNCGFKASYQPGRHLTFKFRKLLKWMGAEDSEIKRLVIEAIRIKDLVTPEEAKQEPEEKIDFNAKDLPEGSVSFSELRTFFKIADPGLPIPKNIETMVMYLDDRKIDMNKYEFYITESVEHKLNKRIIIPSYWQGKLVGYTARAVDDGIKPKYYDQNPPNFVFNVDKQDRDNKFVLVVEGPFDAMSIDGLAVMGNEVSEQQADIIDSLAREVIVVPDFDYRNNKWSGDLLVKAAQEYGWNVSFPMWRETCKDANEAVIKYGKLFVLKSILDSTESSKLKIELMRKRILH